MYCKAGGDAVSLAAAVLTGHNKVRGREFIKVKEWLATGEFREVELHEDPPPERVDPTSALLKAVPVRLLPSVPDGLQSWLDRKRLTKNIAAGWLPEFYAPWWRMSRRFPLVIPACSGVGKVESMHGIAVDADTFSKTIWPSGADSRELLFATASTREWLAGKRQPKKIIAIAEGASDFLTVESAIGQHADVIGFISGSAKALKLVRGLTGAHIVVVLDEDVTGRKYEKEVVDSLFPHIVRPTTLSRIREWLV